MLLGSNACASDVDVFICSCRLFVFYDRVLRVSLRGIRRCIQCNTVQYFSRLTYERAQACDRDATR